MYGVGRSDEDLQIDDVHVPVDVRAGELELLRKGIVLGLQLRIGPLVCGAPLGEDDVLGILLEDPFHRQLGVVLLRGAYVLDDVVSAGSDGILVLSGSRFLGGQIIVGIQYF